ncbi:hypothetical protein [Candidatus Electronema sp. TJ]|uniref:hypothetical protein n=1 Tax=Candidatus Electronema sp. TJ TaxID=3401573 RepID=UPI003AA7D22D
MNLTLSHLLAGLLLLAAVWFAAARSALCVLRRKNVPLDSAKEVSRILSAAFFVIYLCSGALASLALPPQAAGFLRGILPQTAQVAPAPPLEELELPQGRMSAEQDRAERHRLLSEAVKDQETAARQEQVYVAAESIFGINESESLRWQHALQETAASQQQTPSSTAVSPELPQQEAPARDERVSVQELVLISGSMPLPSAAPPAASPQPIQQQAASSEIELSAKGLQLPAPAENRSAAAPPPVAPLLPQPTAQTQPPSQPVQTQQPAPALRNVRCEEIKIFMDGTDIDVLRAMIAKPVGGSDSWKGLRGKYTVSRTGRKGGCAEYTLQADLQGSVLQCRQVCQNIAPPPSQSTQTQQPAFSGTSGRQSGGNDKNVIREAMDDADVDKFLDILEQAESTVPRVWKNQRSGNRYTVTLLRSRGPCREFDVQAIIQGEPLRYRESNCD